MSQRDLVAELRTAHVAAPPELRRRVQAIAAADTSSTRRAFAWRRALVVLVPVAAAVAATVVFTRPADHAAAPTVRAAFDSATQLKAAPQTLNHGSVAVGAPKGFAPSVSPSRVQKVGATLALRIPTPAGVSNGVKQAIHIVTLLGGYPLSVHATASGGAASANLVLKVPRSHVQQAVTRLSQLGTIVGEQANVQDLTTGINTVDRTIALLQRRLASLRAQTQTDTVKRQTAALTTRIASLQRGQATTIRNAHYATVRLSLSTRTAQAVKHGHGPLHGLGVAFRWIGIGLVYVLALGVPAAIVVLLGWLAVRTIRRRRIDALIDV